MLAVKHAFSEDVCECEVADGLSLREIIGQCGDDLAITLNSDPIPPELWASTFPLPGSIVTACPRPHGGDARSIILTVGLIAAAFFAGPAIAGVLAQSGSASAFLLGSSASAFWTGAVYVVGSLAISALIKPPVVQPDAQARQLQSVTGVRNDFRPFQSVPVIYGRHKVFPPYAAIPWTEVVGDDQYLNALFALGLGNHDIEDAKIGETLLTNYQGVELTQTKTPVWPAIIEDPLTTELEDPNWPTTPTSTATFTTADNIEAISVDFMVPIGLRYTTDKAERFMGQIDFRVEFRLTGSFGAWLNVRDHNWLTATHGSNDVLSETGLAHLTYVGPVSASPINADCFRVQGNTSDSLRFGMKWDTPTTGQWDVRVTRVHFYSDRFGSTPFGTTQSEWDKTQQKFVWTALRSHDIDGTAVATDQDVDFLVLRIKASDTVQGVLDQFSVIATRRLRSWDKASQTFLAEGPTRSPAWAYLDMLTGSANSRPVTDPVAKIWLDEIFDWDVACAAADRKFDRVFDQSLTLFDVLGLCAAAGRAGRSLRDARFTIITEEQAQLPSQLFTPRNSRNFAFSQQFFTMPHALKVQFLSEQQDYKQDEIVVYDDGYDGTNATVFETMTLDGKVDPDEAWKFGRYHLAQARLRPAVYTLEVDVEHLASVRGDLVEVEHDVVLWNLGRGRVARIVGRYITLDENFPILAGVSYKLKARAVTTAGTIKVLEYSVSSPVGEQISTFLSSTTLDPDIVVGDLCILGVSGHEDVQLKILAVEPRAGLTAQLTLVDAAPEINNADTGAIPPYDPNITAPVTPADVVPPTPIIIAVTSGSQLGTVAPDGSRMARVEVAYFIPSFQGTLYDQVEARVRKLGIASAQPWVFEPRQGVSSGGVAVFSVEPGEVYEIQLRVITVYGTPSAWSASVDHTVEGIDIPVSPPGSISATPTNDGIAISLGVFDVEDRTITRVHVVLSTTNDRSAGVSYFFPVPSNFASLLTVDVFIPIAGNAQTFYVWARFEDAYENVGEWMPVSATAGLPVDYPGQTVTGTLVSATNGLMFIETASVWNATTTDLTFEWTRGGDVIAQRVVRVTRTGSDLDDSLISATGEATAHTTAGDGTPALTIFAAHLGSGETVAITVSAVTGGAAGADGSPGAAGADGESYWTPVLTAGMTRFGKTYTKTSGGVAWDNAVYSVERWGACQVSWQPAQTNKNFMIALDDNPSALAGYTDLNYALQCNSIGNLTSVYGGGAQNNLGSYVAGDSLSIQYDGVHVRFVKNGAVLETVNDPGRVFYLDSTFYDVGAQCNNLTFSQMPGGQVDLATQIAGSLTAAFADAGLINANVIINADGTLSAAGGGQVQINQLPGSVTTGQLAANVVTAVSANILFLSALKADLGHITAGDITLNATGAFIKFGTAGAGTGVGFYVDYNTGTPRLFIGDASGTYLYWDGTTLSLKGSLSFTNAVQTFTPTWTGFSVSPSGDLSYLDFGAYVVLFSAQGSGGLTGTSNANSMSITNLPSGIQPSTIRSAACIVQDSSLGTLTAGGVTINGATVQFYMNTVSGTHIFNSATAFATSGSKGLAQGWLIIYPK